MACQRQLMKTDEKFMHHLKMKGVFGIKVLNGFNKSLFLQVEEDLPGCDKCMDDEDSDCKFCGCRICGGKEKTSSSLAQI